MSCQNSSNLTDRCPDVTSSDCVSYQGNPYTCLSICTGDNLTKVLNSSNTAICSLLTTVDLTGITIPSCLTTIFGTRTKTVYNFIDVLTTEVCTLQTEIDTINTQLATFNPNITLDYKCCSSSCVTSSTNTLTQSLQNIINCLCDVSTSVVTLQTLVNSFDSRISALEAQMGAVGTGSGNVSNQLALLTANGASYQSEITALQGSVSNLCSGNPC